MGRGLGLLTGGGVEVKPIILESYNL